jgi:hypothetical protein
MVQNFKHIGQTENVHSTKLPLGFDVYRFMCLGMMKASDDFKYVFAHLFQVMGWNTMSR